MDTSCEKMVVHEFQQVAIRLSKNYVIDHVSLRAVIDVVALIT
jgi:hypothetical protein